MTKSALRKMYIEKHRVGYGKGFYDRFLERCRPNCAKIGLSIFPPVDLIADTKKFDIRMDACMMPDGMMSFA